MLKLGPIMSEATGIEKKKGKGKGEGMRHGLVFFEMELNLTSTFMSTR